MPYSDASKLKTGLKLGVLKFLIDAHKLLDGVVSLLKVVFFEIVMIAGPER